jgi:HK97 family phage portal protein
MTGIPADVLRNLGNDGGPVAAGSSGLSSPAGWFTDWATGGGSSSAEVRVNEFTALNYATLFTCVKVIANTIAGLPLKVYRRRADGGQDEVPEHPASALLQREYNPNATAFVGRQAGIGHLLTWGNSYTQIVRSRAGELLELRPVAPDLVCPETDGTGNLYYEVRDRETGRDIGPFARADFLHVPFYTFDALVGLSMVRMARGMLRQGLGQDRQAERFVTSGMRSPGVIQKPDKFKTDAEAIQWRDRFRSLHNKADSDSQVIILESGATWHTIGVNPEAAQLLESRRFTRVEIAGYYGVPPHLIGESVPTYPGTGIEEMNIGFATYCLLPILEMIEQEMNRKLFRADEPDLFVKHELKGLLRGDALKRSQALQVQMQAGVLTVNEWRRLEGMNPVEGGDVRYFPLNMGRVDDAGDDVPPPAAESPAPPTPSAPPAALSHAEPKALPPAPADTAAFVAFRKSLTREAGKCLRKEAAEACKAAKKPAAFVTWIDDFYAKLADQIRDVYDTDLTAGWAERHLLRSRADLLAAAECRPADLPDRVAACVEKWPTDRLAETIAELTHAPV